MRNPERIDEFCNRLAAVWHKVPDWRFGQLMMNIFGNNDIFYYEDNTLINIIENYLSLLKE